MVTVIVTQAEKLEILAVQNNIQKEIFTILQLCDTGKVANLDGADCDCCVGDPCHTRLILIRKTRKSSNTLQTFYRSSFSRNLWRRSAGTGIKSQAVDSNFLWRAMQ